MDLLDKLQQPGLRLEASGAIQHMNAAWCRLAGLPSPPIGQAWSQWVTASDRDHAVAQFEAATRSQQTVDLECRLLDAQGEARWHLISLQPAGEDCLCVATDIHALKLREQALQVQARLQTEMLNIGPDCVKLLSADGRLIYANRAGCAALGIPEGSSFGMPWLDLLPEEIRAAGEAALATVRTGQPARFPGQSVLPGQPPQYWDNLLTPTKLKDGQDNLILCVSRDVTGEREAQQMLLQHQQRLAMAASVGGLGVWDYDIPNDVLLCDEPWYRIMGRDPACPIRSIAEFRPFIHPEDVDRATSLDLPDEAFEAGQGHYKIEFRILHPGGSIRWVRSVACVIREADGLPTRAVGFVMDITDAKRSELALQEINRTLEKEKDVFERQSLEDPLTGLANRRFLTSELPRICSWAKLHRQSVAVAMLDVDHFKKYNDHYGHLQGDEALRGVASALQSIARRTDVVARYGGEEFLVIFPDMDHPEPVLQRLAAAVEALDIVHAASPFGRLTISCGCVVFGPDAAITPVELLAAGDAVLYEAKAGGRNRHIIRRQPAGRVWAEAALQR